jgi:phosphopantothenoylcysteine decarboxylase/phosphopantothenate--cysteine ligase
MENKIMKVLITSGGCKVPIDDVRYITNFSSGRYGAELADEFMRVGHDVFFFAEKGSKEPNYIYHKFDDDGKVISINPQRSLYKDYYEYLNVKNIIKEEQPDIIISAAAISDYIVDKTEGKISSDQDELSIKLKKGEKVIKSFRELAPNAYIVGFKLLVSPSKEETYEAIKKQISYVDMVVYIDLTKLREGKNTRYAFSQGEIPGSVNMEYVQCMSPKDLVHHIIMGRVNKTLKYSI